MTPWRRATYAVVIIWIAAMARLFIADVWDETSALVVFGDAHQSAIQLVSMILKTPLPFWRPVPTIFAALTIHALPFDVACKGCHRPFRVITVCLGQPKDRHHGVADELLQGPAVLAYDSLGDVVVATEEGADLFGVHLLAHRR